MSQVEQVQALIRGISPASASNIFENVALLESKLEKDPRKRRLWRAMSTALTRTRMRWEEGERVGRGGEVAL